MVSGQRDGLAVINIYCFSQGSESCPQNTNQGLTTTCNSSYGGVWLPFLYHGGTALICGHTHTHTQNVQCNKNFYATFAPGTNIETKLQLPKYVGG